jgi:predicted transposase/invertase (TIGR01784 family)
MPLWMYFNGMSRFHDKWYTRIFSDPHVVQDLLCSFVREEFVRELDFSTLKKLNTKFIPVSEKSRHADVVYEVKSHGQSAYIYLFLEFQSTVDRFMALRMARYMFEFYQEIQRLNSDQFLNPPFPILIYNGDETWNAPTSFTDLLYPSSIPRKYLPEFTYFKIAINEIPKRDLVKIRNAAAAIFYVENSTSEDMAKNRKELVSLLSAVLKKEGAQIVQDIIDRIFITFKFAGKTPEIKTLNDLTEVSSMWETAVKKHDELVFEKGIEKGIDQGIEEGKKYTTERMLERGMSLEDIHAITGFAKSKIAALKRKWASHKTATQPTRGRIRAVRT